MFYIAAALGACPPIPTGIEKKRSLNGKVVDPSMDMGGGKLVAELLLRKQEFFNSRRVLRAGAELLPSSGGKGKRQEV